MDRQAEASWCRGRRSPSRSGSGSRSASSVTPSSASSARWPSAVPPPWLPIAATTNGSKPSAAERRRPPRGRSGRSRRSPGCRRSGRPVPRRARGRRSGWSRIARATAAGTSATSGWSKLRRTRAIGGKRHGRRSWSRQIAPGVRRPGRSARTILAGAKWRTPPRVRSAAAAEAGAELRNRAPAAACAVAGSLASPGSVERSSRPTQAACRFLRTRRTRATAPIMPAQASTVVGSGTGTSWIVPPWAE